MAKLFIGTSGWVYEHWQSIFYPDDLPSRERLKYFSHHFKSAEVNYSFYHLPRASTFQNWHNQTPEDFVFSVKASRFITHIKRLKGVEEAWKTFAENALNLKEKLGPILFQFPPSFKATQENVDSLQDFLSLINKGYSLRYAFEFRHKSWCDEKIYKMLEDYGACWVIADSPSYPKAEVITADFAYVRMHGSKILFSSKYTTEELRELAEKVKEWLKSGDVYVYFNNDVSGFAVENAKELIKLCS